MTQVGSGHGAQDEMHGTRIFRGLHPRAHGAGKKGGGVCNIWVSFRILGALRVVTGDEDESVSWGGSHHRKHAPTRIVRVHDEVDMASVARPPDDDERECKYIGPS